MKCPINMPFLMVEKENKNITENRLCSVRFCLIKTEKEFFIQRNTFENPVAIHYYSLINKAAELGGYVWDNRLKEWLSII